MAQSEVITTFEDNTTCLPDYQNYEQELYALRDIVGANNFSLQTDGSFRIMHYVGFFQKGKTRIQILPKVQRKSIDPAQECTESLDFIYRLLHWTGFLKHKSLKPQDIGSSETDLLEIFISLFINDFNDLFRRKIFRKYEEKVELQQFIKGKILFSETVRVSPVLRHRHVVRFDEYSINNSLNKIFKSLLLQLILQTNSRDNKKKIAQGLTYLEDVDYVPLTAELFRSIKFNRLNADFESLFNLAKLFFHNHQPGLNDGKEKTLSFLVPINSLFEHFVYKLLSNFSDETYIFHYQKNRLHLLSNDSERDIELRPDYTITKGNDVITILDAKYKSPFNEKEKIDLKESDIYQMCAYALRYNVNKLFLIYPKFLGVQNTKTILERFTIDSGNRSIMLTIVQIDITKVDFLAILEKLRKDLYYELIN